MNLTGGDENKNACRGLNYNLLFPNLLDYREESLYYDLVVEKFNQLDQAVINFLKEYSIGVDLVCISMSDALKDLFAAYFGDLDCQYKYSELSHIRGCLIVPGTNIISIYTQRPTQDWRMATYTVDARNLFMLSLKTDLRCPGLE